MWSRALLEAIFQYNVTGTYRSLDVFVIKTYVVICTGNGTCTYKYKMMKFQIL